MSRILDILSQTSGFRLTIVMAMDDFSAQHDKNAQLGRGLKVPPGFRLAVRHCAISDTLRLLRAQMKRTTLHSGCTVLYCTTLLWFTVLYDILPGGTGPRTSHTSDAGVCRTTCIICEPPCTGFCCDYDIYDQEFATHAARA